MWIHRLDSLITKVCFNLEHHKSVCAGKSLHPSSISQLKGRLYVEVTEGESCFLLVRSWFIFFTPNPNKEKQLQEASVKKLLSSLVMFTVACSEDTGTYYDSRWTFNWNTTLKKIYQFISKLAVNYGNYQHGWKWTCDTAGRTGTLFRLIQDLLFTSLWVPDDIISSFFFFVCASFIRRRQENLKKHIRSCLALVWLT